MMFLLRTAFWISVALALLPSVVSKQTSTVPADIGAADAMNAASATVADLSGFCERRPEACAAGAHVATAFWQRVRVGATILYDFAGDQLRKTDRIVATPAGPAANAGGEGSSAEVAKSSQHTLTTGDMTPPWRDPHARRDASSKRSS
jgi:hypothetical protein